MKIKVCGSTLPQQVSALDNLGITFAGFNFYPGSPRYMAQKISPEKMRQIKGKIIKVGVFVNPVYEKLMKTVEDYRLDMVQLHGDESPSFCEKITDYISVIKAFHPRNGDIIQDLTAPFVNVCDFFMFDTFGVGYGGSGKKFDWALLTKSPPVKPYFLSGGIEPGDETKLHDFVSSPAGDKLFAIDINTKFEISPGVKNIDIIKKFAESLGVKK